MSLSRQEQRLLGVLQVNCARSVEGGFSTAPVTVWASADQMEHLAIEGGETLRDYSPKQRRRMASEGRAMPDGSFPIADCTDASNAIRSVGRAAPSKRPRVKAFIRRRVAALGCKGGIFDDYR